MSDISSYLWLIPALPLLGSAVIALFGSKLLKQFSHWPCIIGAAGSCVLSFMVLLAIRGAEGEGPSEVVIYYQWFRAGTVDIGFTLRADALTAIMLCTVTFIGTLIAIYSVGYMHGDPGYPRFFAAVALFLAAMTLLVTGSNFLLLYAGWEGVGLCSYLLIGFWFEKPSAADAARKAFLVNRIGDLGFFLGILLVFVGFQPANNIRVSLHSLDYDTVFQNASAQDPGFLTVVCLLLFCGAVGKSAQFPLHVWLPDAMEGPSPVSALIHAATMVTAGVYMVARLTPLFEHAPDAQLVVSVVGGFTALLAALIALTQNDLKRVMAYSTVSQLGYMFLALGSGRGELASFAAMAAVFHLFTHAFFKALLFLASGSVMHCMGNVIDMRRFSGLRHVLKTTHILFLCGASALAGFPLLSGFWSKDEILSAALHASQHPGEHTPAWHGTVYLVLFISALVTAGLTAFYTFRAYFMTFWGELRVPPEALQPHGHGAHGGHGGHGHEPQPEAIHATPGDPHAVHDSPAVMLVPMMILAIGALVAGIIVEPFTHWFSGLIGRTPFIGEIHEHEVNLLVPALGSLMALGGIFVAWWMYARQPGIAVRLATQFQGFYQASLNKFYFDELYEACVVKPLAGFAEFCRLIDQYLVDGLVDLIGMVPGFIGRIFRPIQNGLVQFYALAMMLGLTVFLIALVWRYGW